MALLELRQRGEVLPISVLIPSYRGGMRLVRLVKSLLQCNHSPFEIIVVADEPSEGELAELKEMCEHAPIKLLARSDRLGKVSALNEGLKLARGDIVLFLDDDVLIEDPDFLRKIVEAMESYDIVDIKKVVIGKGLLSKLVHMEYTAYNFASKLMAKLAGRTIAINGAAFAMRRVALEELNYFRPRLSEDFDLALRTFVKGLRFSYVETTYVLNYAPHSWQKWFKQRKRWAVALASWLKENYRDVLKAVLKMPHVVAIGLLASLPSLLTTAVIYTLYNASYPKAIYLAFLSLSSFIKDVIPFAFLLSFTLHVAYAVTTLMLALLLISLGIFHAAMARYVKMNSRVHLLPVYLLFYQPLWLTVLLVGFARVLILGHENVEDWVV